MKKVYSLHLNNLFDTMPKSQYDKNKIYAISEFVIVDKENKQKFIKELTQIFKTKLKENLKLEYECENCGESSQYKYMMGKCKKCGCEVCEYCSTYEDLCEKCESKIN